MIITHANLKFVCILWFARLLLWLLLQRISGSLQEVTVSNCLKKLTQNPIVVAITP